MHAPGPVVCLIAGPGSGKTRTLCATISRLLQDGKPPESIAVMTFTVAGAAEFRERLVELHGIPETMLGRFAHIGTAHSYARRVLKSHGIQFELATDEVIVETIKAVAKEFRHTIASQQAIIEALSGPLQPGTIGQVIAAVRKRLKAAGLLSYDMQLSEATALIRGARSQQIRHLFVDEYQDTAELDQDLYAAINAEFMFVVGDPDQSIYGFRGAKPERLTGIAVAIESNLLGGQVITLETNYRCAPEICSFAQRVIEQTQVIPKQTIPAAQRRGLVAVQQFQSEEEELLAIAEWAVGREGSERAVLCRYNVTATRIADVLRAKGLSVIGDITVEPGRLMLGLQMIENGRFTESVPPRVDDAFRAIQRGLGCYDDGDTFLICKHFAETSAELQMCRELIERGIAPEDLARAVTEYQPTSEGAVHVSTIHRAKGREWQNVWIAGCNEKSIPDTVDDRRLFFVGITRAKDALVCSHATSSVQPGGPGGKRQNNLKRSPLL